MTYFCSGIFLFFPSLFFLSLIFRREPGMSIPPNIVSTVLPYVCPIISFLHHPLLLPQPRWLMLGTCCILSLPSNKYSRRRPLLVTAAHVLKPWELLEETAAEPPSAQQPLRLGHIPPPLRKLRYVSVKGYSCDLATGSSTATVVFTARPVAAHPTEDVALLEVDDGEFLREREGMVLDPDHDGVFNNQRKSCANSASLTVHGFRGRDLLGNPFMIAKYCQTTTSSNHSQGELENLLHLQQQVPLGGQQQFWSALLQPCSAGRGRCRLVGGSLHNGMSGGPVVCVTEPESQPHPQPTPPSSSRCVGILLKSEDVENHKRGLYNKPRVEQGEYLPSSVIFKWIESLDL